MPYEEGVAKKALGDFKEKMKIVEQHLKTRKFFVGDAPTLADVAAGIALNLAFTYSFDGNHRKGIPSVMKWFNEFTALPQWRNVLGRPRICTKAF
jgi:glutathione S-transferase